MGTSAWSFICYNFIWLSGIYKNAGDVGVGGVCGRCKRPAAVPEIMLQGSVYLEGGGEVIEEETHTSCRGQSLLFLQFFLPATPVCFFPLFLFFLDAFSSGSASQFSHSKKTFFPTSSHLCWMFVFYILSIIIGCNNLVLFTKRSHICLGFLVPGGPPES